MSRDEKDSSILKEINVLQHGEGCLTETAAAEKGLGEAVAEKENFCSQLFFVRLAERLARFCWPVAG